MKIDFSIAKDKTMRKKDISEAAFLAPYLYYEEYIADVVLTIGGVAYSFSEVPMLFFVTALQRMLFESYLTGNRSIESLWDTGHRFSLTVEGDVVVTLEIPIGNNSLRIPISEFLSALKSTTVELLRILHDDRPSLLMEENIFEKGSIQHQAAQLFFCGKLSRDE